MLLLAAFASAPDAALTDALLELSARLRPARVLLFGEAAGQVARDLRAERAEADERYLDEAARYLLEGGPAPPSRERDGALARTCLVASREPPESFAPLEVTERAMEMSGRFLLMALPDERSLESEDLENAAAWIVGGARRSLEERSGRPVLVPGDFSPDGVVLAVELIATRLVARAVDRDGNEVEARLFDLQPKTRMRVR